MAGHGLLLDVADAVASDEDVDWRRCAERARPSERAVLGRLRTFAGICRAAGPRAGAAWRRATAESRGARFTRRAIGVVVAVALAQSAVGLATGAALLPAATAGMLAAFGDPAPADLSPRTFLPVADMSPATRFLRTVPHLLYPLCGLVLFVGGRFDRRARLLGAVLILLGAFWAQPVVDGLGVGVYPELFLPAVFWMFVREFPRVRRRTRLDDGAAGVAVVAAVLGGVVQAANLPFVQTLHPGMAVLARDAPGAYVAPAFFGPYCMFVLAALAVLLLRAFGVAAEERRRTGLFIAGIAAALAPHAEGLVEVLRPGTVTVVAANWIAGLGSVAALAVPTLTLYAAIALRVLDVRTTLRVSVRRLLTRGALVVLTAGPLVAFGLLATSRADRPLGDVFGDPLAAACLGGAAAALAALAFRERLLAWSDAWVSPETSDQRRALAAAGAELGRVTGPAEVGTVVDRAARRGVGASATLFMGDGAAGADGSRFDAAGPALPPLPRTSAIAHVLEQLGAPLLVDPDARNTAFDLLPPEEAAWVAATTAAVVVPVAGPGAVLAGFLAVRRRTDAGRLRPVDLAFLAALAAAAGLALQRLRLEAGPTAPLEPAACVCRGCGRVAAPADAGPRCAVCGGVWADAPLPALLAGKFAVERRIGAGGMGTVYLARDVGLDRPVAVKALDRVSSDGLVRLKTEAQAMAAQAHPGIAQVYGLETWRGRPLLVVEYLGGGTLADRLVRGPLPAGEAVDVALSVAVALGVLHAAGYRHGDVKPSNVGFAADGRVKLLDFGLAGPAGGLDRPVGGTLPYLAPETLVGAPAGVADDLWALGVMLYEMVAGRRPFGGATPEEVAADVRRRRLPPLPAVPAEADIDVWSGVLRFTGDLLTAPRSARPPTADAFAAALRARGPGSVPRR